MKKILQIGAIWAVCLYTIAAPLAAQTVTINKSLVGTTSTFNSGEIFSYQIKVVVNGGNAVDLEITDVLPHNLGIDPNNIINSPVAGITPTVTVTGGTPFNCGASCGGGTYQFGATIKWKFSGTLPSGTTFFRQISVKSREGETFACQQINRAWATASNILCSPLAGDPPTTPQLFYSNAILVNINAKSDWIVSKKSIGYVGVNIIRYKITIDRQNPGNCYGFHNLYNPVITDVAPTGAQIWAASGALVTGQSTAPPNVSYISLNTLDICQSWPQYIYVDVAYPCNIFPAGTSVQNCINLTGESPKDCNDGKPAYKEGPYPLCAGLSYDKTVSDYNFTLSGIMQTYNYPVTPPNVITYPSFPQKYVCTTDVLPQFYKTDLSIDKDESYPANHYPGCQGQYRIRICNNGNTPATNISVVDNWPQPCSNLLLLGTPFYSSNSISVPPPFSGVTVSPGGTFPNCPTTVTFNPQSGFVLYPGECITITMNFEINSSTPLNTLIRNCVTVNYAGSFQSWPLCSPVILPTLTNQDCYEFYTEGPKPKPTICKSVVGGTNYVPGDKVKYKICISNYGGAGYTGILTDLLDPQLINPTVLGYYFDPNAGSTCLTPGSYTPSSGAATQTSAPLANPITWNVNLPAQCKVNQYATLCILIQAEVAPYTPSGTYWNKATLTPSGLPSLSANAPITVAQLVTTQTWKCVKGDLDTDFNAAGTATPGSTVKFRISVLNSGNVPVTDIAVGDQLQLPFTAFLSSVAYYLNTGPVPTTGCPATVGAVYTAPVTANYIASMPTPVSCLTQNGCTVGTCPPLITSLTPTGIIQLKFGSLVLLPGQMLTIELQAITPIATPVGTRLCNKAWVRACSKVDNTSTQVSISDVCLTVKPFVPNCCPTNVKTDVQLLGPPVPTPQSNGTLITANFALSATPVPIQEVRVTIVDKNIAYQPDAACVQCYTPYKFLGTFTQPIQSPLNTLPVVLYAVINKELVYKGVPVSFAVPQNLAVNILLPDLQNIPCCEAVGEICLKFVFKDANCNYCEKVVCFPVRYQGQ